MTEMTHIQMPIWQLPVLVLIPLAVLAGVVMGLRRLVQQQNTAGEEPDWSVPPIETTIKTSLLHGWDVRCKIVTILLYAFLIAGLRHLTPALAAIVLSGLVLLTAKSSLLKVLMRLLAIVGFISMFLMIMPFSAPIREGDTVLIFGGLDRLGFNLRGLHLAMIIAAKAIAITMLMEPLIATAPLPVTLYGLSRLGAPDMVAQMILLSYRYLQVFRSEARRMAAGMQVRGFRKRTNFTTLRAVANFLGMLFVRSFERTERVFDAMRARGYQGRFPEMIELHLQTRDIVLAVIWLLTGLTLFIFDRLAW